MTEEEQFQERVIQILEDKELYTYNVIFTYELGQFGGLLSITMFTKEDLNKLIEFLSCNKLCDKSGLKTEGTTLLLTGMALSNTNKIWKS